VGKKENARTLILKTAEDIVARNGVSSLTFDKVAVASGLSKGGILYHFKSKNELVKAMVEQFVSRFEGGLYDLKNSDGEDVGQFSRAYLRATMGEAATTGEDFDRLGASITTALSAFPDYLEIIRQQNNRCQEGVENDGLDPVLATIIRLAVEGMWMAEVFDVMKLDSKMKREVVARLIKWTYDGETA
jgi:AcrR family transcriptional regulator